MAHYVAASDTPMHNKCRARFIIIDRSLASQPIHDIDVAALHLLDSKKPKSSYCEIDSSAVEVISMKSPCALAQLSSALMKAGVSWPIIF